ncbi:MAG: butyrate kinase [Fidelibacterota bacterium]|nr:MAG: butyrate kinase [Candidatus Neomarinimicrobiota bacterium]
MTSHPATVLVLNPGSTSTQIALFTQDAELWREELLHEPAELDRQVIRQLDLRWMAVESHLQRVPSDSLAAVVGRGGPLKPLPGGTYAVNEPMLADLSSARFANHASNLGALLADRVAQRYGIPAYVVDPVTTDEFEPVARLSGVPEFERRCRSHALNIKAVARQVADQLERPLEQTNFIVAHLGGGISVTALRSGRIVDVNDALLGMGPFSPERAGALPLEGLLGLAFSGDFTFDELSHKLSRQSGLMGYIGTNDLGEVLKLVDGGSEQAAVAYQAMIYQIAKEIGAMAAVLKGQVDAVILTGGMARSTRLVEELSTRIDFLGPVTTIPGSLELEALAQGAWRVINGEETVREYV